MKPYQKAKKEYYCELCGKKIIWGRYCMACGKERYKRSDARYERLLRQKKKKEQMLQIAPALGWTVNEAKWRASIAEIEQKLAEMEKINPKLKEISRTYEKEGK